MLFLRRFLTTFKRLERFFSQPIFTSVLYDMNTRDNNELKIRTSPQNRQKKQLLIFISFCQSLLDYRYIESQSTMTPMLVSQQLHVQKFVRSKGDKKKSICFWQGLCRWKVILARGSRPKANNNELHDWSVIFKVMIHIFSSGRRKKRTVTKQTD